MITLGSKCTILLGHWWTVDPVAALPIMCCWVARRLKVRHTGAIAGPRTPFSARYLYLECLLGWRGQFLYGSAFGLLKSSGS